MDIEAARGVPLALDKVAGDTAWEANTAVAISDPIR